MTCIELKQLGKDPITPNLKTAELGHRKPTTARQTGREEIQPDSTSLF